MNSTVLMALMSALTSLITFIITRVVTRKKNKVDLLIAQIQANKEQLEFYIKLVNDQSEHLKTYMDKSDTLEGENTLIREEVTRLKRALLKVINDVCVTKDCKARNFLNDTEVHKLLEGEN